VAQLGPDDEYNGKAFLDGRLALYLKGKIKGKYLEVNMSNVSSSSNYILDDIVYAVKNIPIDQDIPVGTKFTLEAKATGNTFRVVTSADIRCDDPKLANKFYFDKNIELFFIESSTQVTIKDIRVVEGYSKDDAAFSQAHLCIHNVLDEEPYNHETKTGVRSAMSRANKFLVKFQTNGNVDPKKIIISAFNEILAKLNKVIEQAKNLTSSSNNNINSNNNKSIKVPDEDDAIGGLFTWYFNNLLNITLTHDYNSLNNILHIKVLTNENTYIHDLIAKCGEFFGKNIDRILRSL
jgi:DNA-directed RNA polymerase subunit L